MKKEASAILLRIFLGESDKYEDKNTYQFLVEYLRKNNFSGVTVLRGLEGFGQKSIVHTSNLLELSSDLPIVVEVVDKEEKINKLKKFIDEKKIIESGLITEEKVKIIQYGSV
jgi:PII-like signaling protein